MAEDPRHDAELLPVPDDTVWAIVVVTTVASLVLYTLTQERVVSANLGVTAP